jgi:hypothetical protein
MCGLCGGVPNGEFMWNILLSAVSGTQKHISKAGFPEGTNLSGGRGEVSELSISCFNISQEGLFAVK